MVHPHIYAFDAETLNPLWDQSFPEAPDRVKYMSHITTHHPQSPMEN
jgi:hypothetical protein